METLFETGSATHDALVQVPEVASPGDLWQVGEGHLVLCGDSCNPAALERLLGGACIDALITDPPYSSGGMVRSDRMLNSGAKYVRTGTLTQRPDFSGDNRDQRSWVSWVERWSALCLSHAREGAVLGIWSDWRQLPSLTDAVQGGGWVWRGIAVWDKTAAARPQGGRFRHQAEYLVWGSAGPLPQTTGGEKPAGVLTCTVDRGKQHQTQKPVDVCAWSASMVSPGGLVLDPFLGSGSMLLACDRRGLQCRGAEVEPRNVDLILYRAMRAGMEVKKIPV